MWFKINIKMSKQEASYVMNAELLQEIFRSTAAKISDSPSSQNVLTVSP